MKCFHLWYAIITCNFHCVSLIQLVLEKCIIYIFIVWDYMKFKRMNLLILERNNCSTFKQGYEMESYNNSYALIMSHAKKKCAKLKPQMLPFFRETVWLINELLAQVKHIVELLNIHLYVRFRKLEDKVLCKFNKPT